MSRNWLFFRNKWRTRRQHSSHVDCEFSATVISKHPAEWRPNKMAAWQFTASDTCTKALVHPWASTSLRLSHERQTQGPCFEFLARADCSKSHMEGWKGLVPCLSSFFNARQKKRGGERGKKNYTFSGAEMRQISPLDACEAFLPLGLILWFVVNMPSFDGRI